MEDPVMLPNSKNIVDRSTIGKYNIVNIILETHLLSDSTDPFNRTKLTKEDLIPVPELKEKIEEYKKSKQA
jgi:ubiquitin conjugation factor E4 B